MDYKRMSFYQVYPRSYCDSNGDGIGDIKGIISKLDYIASLGVNGIWFSPLYCSPNADYGYDISNYRDINPEYGTMEDFYELIEQMHKRNLKCIMDLVINHTSSQHEWFIKSRQSKDNPYRDYYFWRKGRGKNGLLPPNNWTSFFTGSAWKYDELTKEWYLHLFDDYQPDLNYDNPRVIEEVEDILTYWLDKGVDGFRCDVITILNKTKGLPNGKGKLVLVGKEHYVDNVDMKSILARLKRDCLDKYDTYTVGESVLITVDKALRYIDEKDKVLDTIFAFDHMNADNVGGIRQLPAKFNLNILKKANQRWQNGLYGKAWNTNYLENHDQARIVGRYCSIATEQLRVKGAKMLANVMLFLSGTPYIYQGQEIGMTSMPNMSYDQHKDTDYFRSYQLLKKIFGRKTALAKLSVLNRDNARTPMQWNAEPQAGFSINHQTWLPVNPNYLTVNVESQLDDGDSILNYYKQLIALRVDTDEMIFGTYTLLNIGGRKLYAYLREYNGKRLLVMSNFTDKQYSMRVPKCLRNCNSHLLISNYQDSPIQLTDCVLRPYESIVYRLI
ncbi:MAG: alpha-glucosidase [Clostridia bacterium]|nr:alpha-glucosidase [Clostridia bacterium]